MRRSVLLGGRRIGRTTMLAAVAQHLAAQAIPVPVTGLVLRGADALPAGMSHLTSGIASPRLFLSIDPASGDDMASVNVWAGL